MKHIYILTVAFAMSFLAIIGCGTDPVCPEEIGFVGEYDGEHEITLPALGFPLPTGDSLYVTNPVDGDNKVSARSTTLNTTLTCNIDASNCKRVILDTIRIDSAVVSGITIKDVVATGDGDINGNRLVTRIRVVSGTAYDIPIYGNQPLAGTRINGIFDK